METELNAQLPDLDTSGIQTTKGPFTNNSDFLDAVNSAQAGELITLANGTYELSDDEDTKFSRKGTADQSNNCKSRRSWQSHTKRISRL